MVSQAGACVCVCVCGRVQSVVWSTVSKYGFQIWSPTVSHGLQVSCMDNHEKYEEGVAHYAKNCPQVYSMDMECAAVANNCPQLSSLDLGAPLGAL